MRCVLTSRALPCPCPCVPVMCDRVCQPVSVPNPPMPARAEKSVATLVLACTGVPSCMSSSLSSVSITASRSDTVSSASPTMAGNSMPSLTRHVGVANIVLELPHPVGQCAVSVEISEARDDLRLLLHPTYHVPDGVLVRPELFSSSLCARDRN
jgi:hypothetical protein